MPPKWVPARPDERRPAGSQACGTGSALGFVLERELQFGAVRDRPVLVQVNVLLGDFGHPKITDRLRSGPDRFRGCVLPRGAARPDDLDHLVHAHVLTPLGSAARRRRRCPLATLLILPPAARHERPQPPLWPGYGPPRVRRGRRQLASPITSHIKPA